MARFKYKDDQGNWNYADDGAASGNILWGKKYVACGDSYTHGDWSNWTDSQGNTGTESTEVYDADWGVYKTYPYWIAKRNHMTLVNDGQNGSILALHPDYLAGTQEISYKRPFSYLRYQQIPEDADYITIWFGINDKLQGVPVGSIDDATNETFYGAWNVVLSYLIEHHPYAKIGIIVTSGASEAYREAERAAAKKWGIPYLDIMGDAQIYPILAGKESAQGLSETAQSLRKESFVVSDSNPHPNLEAHKFMSTFLENWLRGL